MKSRSRDLFRKVLPWLPLFIAILLCGASINSKELPTSSPIAAIYIGQASFVRLTGNNRDAILLFSEAIDLDPNFDLAYLERGITNSRSENYELAFDDFSKAIGINPENVRAYLWRAYISYRKLDDYSSAIIDLNRAIQINPNYWLAYERRGEVHFNQGDIERAISDLTKAIELNPKAALSYQLRGEAYFSQNKFDLGISEVKTSIQLDPNNPGPSYKLADMYYALGLITSENMYIDLAFSSVDDAIHIDPDYTYAYLLKGHLYYVEREYEQAILQYTKAIEISPQDSLLYFSRGRAYNEISDHKLAIIDFTKSIEIDPHSYRTYFERGMTYIYTENSELAVQDLLFYIQHVPDAEDAEYVKAWLSYFGATVP